MIQNYTPIDDLIQMHKSRLDEAKTPEDQNDEGRNEAPAEPISVSKEAGPGGSPMEVLPVHEAVEKQGVDPDLQQYIEVKPQNMELDPHLQEIGLQTVEKTKYKDFQSVQLPISDDKVIQGLNAPMSSSLRWLAALAMYILCQSHLTLKKIHGKVVRVAKK